MEKPNYSVFNTTDFNDGEILRDFHMYDIQYGERYFMCPNCFHMHKVHVNINYSISIQAENKDKIEAMGVSCFQDPIMYLKCSVCGSEVKANMIDARLAKIISIFNRIGIKTEYCCDGHDDREGYILFNKNSYGELKYLFDKTLFTDKDIKKYWHMEKNDYSDSMVIRVNGSLLDTDDEFGRYLELNEKAANVLEYALSSPVSRNKLIEQLRIVRDIKKYSDSYSFVFRIVPHASLEELHHIIQLVVLSASSNKNIHSYIISNMAFETGVDITLDKIYNECTLLDKNKKYNIVLSINEENDEFLIMDNLDKMLVEKAESKINRTNVL